MKHPAPVVLSIALCAILAGCTSAPTTSSSASETDTSTSVAATEIATQPVATAEADTANAPADETADAPTEPVAEPAPLELSPEAAAVVERLTEAVGHDTLPHELADTTGFPDALSSLEPGARAPKVEKTNGANQPPPMGLTADGSSTQLVVRDWTGLVLVPISTSLSKAYTSEVRLLKVEAHPLNDGRVRVWTRVRNVGNRTLPGQVACSFRMHGETTPSSPYFYELQVPGKGYRDVFFISPDGELVSYTVLVRSEEMKTQR